MNKTFKRESFFGFLKNWFEERYQLKEAIERNVTKKQIPKGLSWFGCTGGLAFVAFLLQAGTGIFLVFHYIPSANEAFNSVQYVRHAIPYGWLIQKVHAVTPHFMVALVLSHMVRILFKGIYKKPRELHWVSGSLLLILTLMISYTGTFLPANGLSYWGVSTAGSEVGMPTMVTDHSVGAYQDGRAISNQTFVLIYALHIAGIPIMMSLFMSLHFLMIRRTGISEPL
ncbi:MAG: cytochrome b N-terminal domain-containing protein [Candidatus Scalindua sp.]|nr:cytochrome b N-terminal domain-containing protein [Candidatus Scalindua sp.]